MSFRKNGMSSPSVKCPDCGAALSRECDGGKCVLVCTACGYRSDASKGKSK